VFWLASSEPLEPDELRLLRQRPSLVITGEPRPMRLADALANPPTTAISGAHASPAKTKSGARTTQGLHIVPRMRRSAGWRTAGEALGDLAPARGVHILMTGSPGQTTLLARLFDALDVAHCLLGRIRSIDATLASPLGSVPESLDRLHGHLMAHVRGDSGRAATVCVSDAAGVWQRRVDVLGEAGWITIDDLGFEWRAVAPRRSEDGADDPGEDFVEERADPPGELVDAAEPGQDDQPISTSFPTSLWDARSHRPTKRPEPRDAVDADQAMDGPQAVSPGVLIGQEIRRLLDGRDNPADLAQPDVVEVLALCEAARLSCRTAQAETPAKLLQMMSARP
jgi:hypothetical protein